MILVSEDTKAARVLVDFIRYCNANPSQRFWQALRNWCGHNFIYAGNRPPWDDAPLDLIDTFNWEGKSK